MTHLPDTRTRASRRRLIVAVVLVLGLLPALAVGLLPLWAPPVAGAVGGAYGVELKDIERRGWGGFAVAAISWEGEGAAARVDEVALANVFTGALNGFHIKAGEWEVVLKEEQQAEGGPELPAPGEVLEAARKAMGTVGRWVAEATVGPGEVRQAGAGKALLTLEQAGFAGGELTASGLRMAAVPLLADLELGQEEAFLFLDARVGHAEVPGRQLRLSATAASGEQSAALAVHLAYPGEPDRGSVGLTARFREIDALPTGAEVQARDFVLPLEWLEAAAPRAAGNLAAVRLNGEADWDGTRYEAAMTLAVEAAQGANIEPTAPIVLAFTGDAQHLRLESLRAETAWLRASLSEPVTLTLPGLTANAPAVLTVESDLASAPVAGLRGDVSGRVRMTPGMSEPALAFELRAEALAWRGAELGSARGEAELRWPELTVSSARLERPGLTLDLAGAGNLRKRELTRLEARLDATPEVLAAAMQEPPAFEKLRADLNASGTAEELEHSGSFSLTGYEPPGVLAPLSAAGTWEGTGAVLRAFALNMTSEAGGRVELAGAARRGPPLTAELDALRLAGGGFAGLGLEQAATVAFEPETGTVRLEGLALAASDGGATLRVDGEVAWPARLELAVQAAALTSALPNAFLREEAALPQGSLDQAAIALAWTPDARPRGELELTARATPPGFQPVRARLDATIAPERLELRELGLSTEGQVVFSGSGFLPIRLDPQASAGGGGAFAIEREEPFALKLDLREAGPLEAILSRHAGLRLVRPDLSLEAGGTLARPEGSLSLRAALLEPVSQPAGESPGAETAGVAEDAEAGPAGIRPPPLRELRVEARLSGGELRIPEARATVAGEPVRLTGTWPGFTAAVEELLAGRLADWSRATGEIETGTVALENLKSLNLPLLQPAGTIRANIRLRPGRALTGELVLQGLATEPVGPLGALRELGGTLRLDGRTLHFEETGFSLGASPVSIAGSIDFGEFARPGYDVTATGRSVPLVRTPGLVLRGDLDLGLTRDASGRTVLGGAVKLERGVYAMGFTDLVGSTSGPEVRAPYFSVKAEPFARWHLDLAVKGETFLRLVMPVFQGWVSADLTLGGTLGEPLASGEVRIPEGRVRFPFATLAVERGIISLTEENPFVPRLDLTASSRVRGYDLRFQLEGTAREPIPLFSSSPSLDSETIQLFLYSGQPLEDDPAQTTTRRLSGLGFYVGRGLLTELGILEPGSGRLEVNVGEEISESGRQTMEVRYRLSDDWSAIGSYDRFDAYNLDFQYRIFGE